MRYSEAHAGRVFVVRLETGDRLLPGTVARHESDPATGASLLEP